MEISLDVRSSITGHINDLHPQFNSYSEPAQKKIIQEVFKRSQALSETGVKSLIGSMALSERGTPVDFKMNHPIGNAFVSFLLAESNWHQKLPSWKEIFSVLPSIFWETDPALSKAVREWLQFKIDNAVQEVPNEKMRDVYLRNLLSYYPYFCPEKGEEIRFPSGTTYRVDPVELTPAYLGSPLMAYGLIPTDYSAPPILLIKGTTYPADKGCFLSILTDINPCGSVGSGAFQWFAGERIEKWLQDNASENRAEVMGTSLGGALSLQAAATYPQYIKEVHAFNSPGVTSDEVKLWNESAHVKPKVNVYLQDGDPVSSFVGSCFAPDWKIHQMFVPEVSLAQVHASAYAAHPESFVIPESAEKVNQEPLRQFWPFVQNVCLFPLFILGCLFLAIKVVALKIYLFVAKLFNPEASL